MEYENFEREIKNNRQKKKAIIRQIEITLVVIGVLILVSIVLCLTVFNKPNKEQLMKEGLTDYFEINDEVGNIESEFRGKNGYITRDNKEKAISAVGEYAKKLFNDKEIKEYNVTKGQSVWIQFNSGIEYVYVPAVDGMDSSEVSTYQPCLSTYDNDLQKYSQECVDQSAENIQNTLEDYKFTNNYDNSDVDIEKLSDIGKNKIVIWHGHGGYSEKTHSFIATGTMLDRNAFLYDVDYYIKNIRYTDEYLNGELIFTNSGHVAVGYKFFNNHLSNIDGCMIYLGACSSGVDDTLAKAFLDKGASTVIGNSGSICTTYNLSMIKTIYEQMLCDTGSDNHYDTIQTALNFAFDKNGKYCCEEDKSHPIIFGDNNFRLSNKETDKTLNSNFVSGKYLICTGEKYICGTAALPFFINRYNQNGLYGHFTYEDYTEDNYSLRYNAALAGEYLGYLNAMAEEFHLENDIRVSTLSRYPDVFVMEEQDIDEKELWSGLEKALRGACEQFVDSRVKEGEALKADLLDKLDAMLSDVDFIEERSPQIMKEYRTRLEEKIQEILGDRQIDDARIATEVTIYADKVCVDEETVRLRSHIMTTKDTLLAGGSIGRKLDFIAQEMNREANTILSKANNIEISDIGIDLKTGIEKVREQIQNIE